MNGAAVDAVNTASRTCSHLSYSAGSYFMMSRTANETMRFYRMAEGASVTTYTTVIG